MLEDRAKVLKQARAARYYVKHGVQIRARNAERHALCKTERNAKSAAYYATHRQESRERHTRNKAANPRPAAATKLRHKYKLGLDAYESLLMAQRWGCAICGGVNENKRRLSVDHDHRTGRVRGLLCNPCNLAIGWMRDNPDRLRAAASYLENPMADKPHVNIKVERYKANPEAQGVVRPKDNSWQLVIDREGYPHLYVRCKLEDAGDGKPGTGMLCIEDMLIEKMTIPDLMKSEFGGKLTPEEEQEAHAEFLARKEATGIPCPRPV